MDTHKLKLEKDKTYTLRIDAIQENVKCFNSNEGRKCRHDITCSDKQGNTGIFEYVTFSEKADNFIQGAYQLVKCVWANEKGCTIAPVDDGVAHLAQQATTAAREPNAYSTNLSGSSICFAVAYSKDLLCAEIATRPIVAGFPEVSDEDVDRMLRYADKINAWMIERVSF